MLIIVLSASSQPRVSTIASFLKTLLGVSSINLYHSLVVSNNKILEVFCLVYLNIQILSVLTPRSAGDITLFAIIYSSICSLFLHEACIL